MTLSQAAQLVAYSAFSFHSEPQAEAKSANDACGLPLNDQINTPLPGDDRLPTNANRPTRNSSGLM
jgi:hypothetical protein